MRAICGLPLGSTEHHSDAVMTNLIGRDIEKWRAAIADPDAKLHIYGKSKIRPGRKMGHVTRLSPRGSLQTGARAMRLLRRRSASDLRSPRKLISAQNTSITTDGKFHSNHNDTRISSDPTTFAAGKRQSSALSQRCCIAKYATTIIAAPTKPASS